MNLLSSIIFINLFPLFQSLGSFSLDCNSAELAYDCFLQDQITGGLTDSGCGFCSQKPETVGGDPVGICVDKDKKTGLPLNKSLQCTEGWSPDSKFFLLNQRVIFELLLPLVCTFAGESYEVASCWYVDGLVSALVYEQIGRAPPFGCGWCEQQDHEKGGFCTGRIGNETRIENICPGEFHTSVDCNLVSDCWSCIGGIETVEIFLETRNLTLDPSFYNYLFVDYECEWCLATRTCSNVRDNVICPEETRTESLQCCNVKVENCGHCYQAKGYGLCDWCESDQLCLSSDETDQCSGEMGYPVNNTCQEQYCNTNDNCLLCGGEASCAWCPLLGEYGGCTSYDPVNNDENCVQSDSFLNVFQICSNAFFDDGTCGQITEICAVCNISVCRATEVRLQDQQSLTIDSGVVVRTEDVFVPVLSTLIFDLTYFNLTKPKSEGAVVTANKCVNISGTLELDIGQLESGENNFNLIESNCVDIAENNIFIKEVEKPQCEFWQIQTTLGTKGLAMLVNAILKKLVDKSGCITNTESFTGSRIKTVSQTGLDIEGNSFSFIETISVSFTQSTIRAMFIEDSDQTTLYGISIIIWIAVASSVFVVILVATIFGVITYKKNKKHKLRMAAAKRRLESMNKSQSSVQLQKETSQTALI